MVLAHDGRRFTNVGMSLQARFNFTQLDAHATNFDLMIQAAEKLYRSIRTMTDAVAGPIESRPRFIGKWVRHECLGCSDWIVEIAATDAGSGYAQFAGRTDRHWFQAAVYDIASKVGDGLADRSMIIDFFRRGGHCRHDHIVGAFRRAVGIDQRHLPVSLEPSGDQGRWQCFTGRQQPSQL